MYNYKITKYCLTNKTEENCFEEWTSISDIGKKYNGKKFLYEDYIKIENSYIEAISMFINLNNITHITIDELEKHTFNKDIYDEYDIQIENLIDKAKNRMQIDICDIDLFVRAILREKMWAKLYAGDKLYIHFGYDYYMYIGSKLQPKEEIGHINKLGLEIEQMDSPYIIE